MKVQNYKPGTISGTKWGARPHIMWMDLVLFFSAGVISLPSIY